MSPKVGFLLVYFGNNQSRKIKLSKSEIRQEKLFMQMFYYIGIILYTKYHSQWPIILFFIYLQEKLKGLVKIMWMCD